MQMLRTVSDSVWWVKGIVYNRRRCIGGGGTHLSVRAESVAALEFGGTHALHMEKNKTPAHLVSPV